MPKKDGSPIDVPEQSEMPNTKSSNAPTRMQSIESLKKTILKSAVQRCRTKIMEQGGSNFFDAKDKKKQLLKKMKAHIEDSSEISKTPEGSFVTSDMYQKSSAHPKPADVMKSANNKPSH